MSATTFGLFLNCGEIPGREHDAVFERARRQADLAEQLGYHDVWVTEHHFIPFGVNPSALAMAAFLLGRTRRLRVGTAVTLTPLYHPLQLAEQAALLDQLSGGRFDFGIGRGGYLREFEAFGIDVARWDRELEATLDVLLPAWTGEASAQELPPRLVTPRPLSRPHLPLFVGSATPSSVERAAQLGLPLLHYFGMPLEARTQVEARYRAAAEAAGRGASVSHMHAFVAQVSDDEGRARDRLRESLTQLFRDGDHPTVPRAANRHVGPDGKPLDRAALAAFVAGKALVGAPEKLSDEIEKLIEDHGIRRLALFMEPIGDGDALYESVERFAKEVAVNFAVPGGTQGKR